MEKQEEIFVRGGMVAKEREIKQLGYEIRKSPNYLIISPDYKIVLEVLQLSTTIMVMNNDKITYCDRVTIKAENGVIIGECYRGSKTTPYDRICASR